jgi:hypothetical protein
MSRRAEWRKRPRSQVTTARRKAAAATMPRVLFPTKARSIAIMFVMKVVEGVEER